MAYTTINKSKDHFDGKIYLGSSSAVTVTGLEFQPDLVWVKDRDNGNNHCWVDAVRGVGKYIQSDNTSAEVNNSSQSISAFTSDGFTTGTANPANESASTTKGFMSWNWKANGAGSSNSDATGSYPITSTVSANTTAGFSIVKYTGNGYSTATIGHGLGVKPAMVIMRPLGYSGAWWIAHKDLSTDNVLEFNTNTQAAISGFGGGGLKYSTFTTSVIGGGNGSSNSDLWNKSGEDYIAYCFAEKQGYSKFGKFVGNSNADGVFIYTGFKPSFILVKKYDGSGHWQIVDTKRPGYNPSSYLRPNSNNAEGTDIPFDILSNGFKARSTDSSYNNSSNTYIYYAVGQSLVGSNNVPCTAR